MTLASTNEQRIPGSFQLLLALYLILTGTFPTIVQAFAFGLQGGAQTEFASAMVTQTARDILLLLPVLVLSKHPLGILHPLVLAVVVWPILRHVPEVIQEWGGWAGILAGTPVHAPYFDGLPARSASSIWTAVAKYNGIEIVGLISAYAGFWLVKGRPNLSRISTVLRNPNSIRAVMICLIGLALLVLILFVRSRGGIDAHLTSLGAGRFKELSGAGVLIVIINTGTIALLIWIAARPGDIKSPLFLAAMAAVMAAEFIANGSRAAAVGLPMTVGLVWAIRRGKVPWKMALVLAPLMFVSIGLLGAIRTSSWYGSTAGAELASAGWANSFERAEEEVAMRRAASASVPVVERGMAQTDGPLLGLSYAPAVTAFVPRPLWPDKPRGVGQMYAREFLGVSMSGTSIPVSPAAEMYWNFGLPGVVLLSFLYGALLRALYYFYWRRSADPFVTVFYVVCITVFHISSDRLVGLEQKVALILFCYTIVVMLIPKERFVAGFGRSPAYQPALRRPIAARLAPGQD